MNIGGKVTLLTIMLLLSMSMALGQVTISDFSDTIERGDTQGTNVNVDNSGNLSVDITYAEGTLQTLGGEILNADITFSPQPQSVPANTSDTVLVSVQVYLNNDPGTYTGTFTGTLANGTVSNFDVSITVTNDAPQVTTIPDFFVPVGQSLNYQIIANDPEGDNLSYSFISALANMDVDTNGIISWTPLVEEMATATIQITDGFDDVVLNFDATSINQPPSITSISDTSTPIDMAFSLQVLANDPENNSLSYSLLQSPAGMSINGNGLISWTPTAEQVATVEVEVSDGFETDTETFDVTVVNTDPEITPIPNQAIGVGDSFSYQVLASDDDGHSLSYSLLQYPPGMSISGTGLITWTPPAEQVTLVEVEVSDGYDTASDTFTITVDNSPPNIVSIPDQQAFYDNAFSYQVLASDPEGDTITFSLIQSPTTMTIDSNTGLIDWLPPNDNDVTIIVQASDGTEVTTDTFDIDVMNTAPSLDPIADQVVPVGPAVFTYQTISLDAEANPITYDLINEPSGMTIDGSGLITWVPPFEISATVTVRVSDGIAATTQVFDISAENGLPVIVPIQDQTVQMLSSFSLPIIANDPEGDVLDYSLQQAPASMTINSVSGVITWNPVDEEVFEQVTVRVSDGVKFATSNFLITVLNDAPIVDNVEDRVLISGRLFTETATATDPEGGPVTFSLVSGPADMTVSSSGLITWTPPAPQTAVVTIGASDGFQTGFETFTLTVRQDAPELTVTEDEILFGGPSQERGELVIRNIVVRNTGTQNISNINATVLDGTDELDSEYQTQVVVSTTFLEPDQQATVTISIFIPEDQDARVEELGELTITGTAPAETVTEEFPVLIQAESFLAIESLELEHDGDDEEISDGENYDELKEGDTVLFTINVENLYTDDDEIEIDDVFVEIEVDDDDWDIDEESIERAIQEDNDYEFTITVDIPYGIDKDTTEVTVRVFGDDSEEDFEHYDELIFTMEIDREDDEIQIEYVDHASPYQCSTQTAVLDIKIHNTGTDDQEEVTLEVVIDDLFYSYSLSDIELDDGDDYSKQVIVPLPQLGASGSYEGTVRTYYNDNDESDEEDFTLEVLCGSDALLYQDPVAVEEQVFYQSVPTANTVFSSSSSSGDLPSLREAFKEFQETNVYVIILGGLMALGMVYLLVFAKYLLGALK